MFGVYKNAHPAFVCGQECVGFPGLRPRIFVVSCMTPWPRAYPGLTTSQKLGNMPGECCQCNRGRRGSNDVFGDRAQINTKRQNHVEVLVSQ